MSIKTQNEAGVFTLMLNRLEKKNALTQIMYQQLADGLREAESDKRVKVVILASQEGVFTAGNDLQDFLNLPENMKDSGVYQFLTALTECKLPLLAAVEGPAIGVGSTMLLHCERVFCDDTAKFALPFINLGLVAEAAASLLLPRLSGYQAAADLLLTGEAFDADKAKLLGLVSEKVAPGTTYDQAKAYAAKLVTKPRATLIDMKALLRRAEEPLMQRIDHELVLFQEKLQGPEVKEAVTAFFEKRAPDFSDL